MTEPTKMPVSAIVGERPYCHRHPSNFVELVCTARECKHRLLCSECRVIHERSSLHHKTLVVNLNDWYKEFNNLKGLFDPADNTSLLYQIEQITLRLSKQQEQLTESQKKMTETFQKLLKEFFEMFQGLNDEMNVLLWKNQKIHEDALGKVKAKLEQMSYKNCKKQIFNLMKSELSSSFQQGRLEEFYTKVYNGYYCDQIYNQFGGLKALQSELDDLRDELEKGFRLFDAKKFEEVCQGKFTEFRQNIHETFIENILQRVELDLINSKGAKVRVIESKNEKLPKLNCLASIPATTATLCTGLSDGTLLTASTSKVLQLRDSLQQYRKMNEIDHSGEDDDVKIKSLCTIRYSSNDSKEVKHLVLLGGDDECPHIEVWNYETNKLLTLFENAHENGISCIQELKGEYSESSGTHVSYIATAACDNMMKVWTLTVSENSLGSELEVKLELYKESNVHSDFISCLVSLPNCKALEGSVVISGSHDKSINFWKWEENPNEFKDLALCEKKKGEYYEEAEDQDTYSRYQYKMKCAHSDFVKAIVFLHEKENEEDVELFASGGGDSMIKIWSLKEKKLIKAFSNNKRSISKMIYLGGGRLVTTANEKQTKEFFVYIWDWQKAQLQFAIKDHKALITNISRVNNGAFLSSDNKVAKIWKLECDTTLEGERTESGMTDQN